MPAHTLTLALLGAPRTGKTQLAAALAQHFHAHTGIRILDDPGLTNATSADLILLMGLDLSPPPHLSPSSWQASDAALRQQLSQQGLSYQVVYGQDHERLRNALHGLARIAPSWQTARDEILPRWQGSCDTCGDGDCEHRLFTRLLKR